MMRGRSVVRRRLSSFSAKRVHIMANDDFSVRFWGVRGSIPCPGPTTVRYGGNTSCLEIRCGDHLLIFDGGTGIRELGAQLAMDDSPLEGELFFTHTHFDHINGVPFFGPLFDNKNTFRLWAGHLLPDFGLEDVLRDMMKSPLFPVPIDIFSNRISYNDFRAGETIEPYPGVVVRTAPLNHPNGATGYRVEYHGKSICYITDTEHVPGKLDETILSLIKGADIVVYDSTYTDEEFPRFVNWGHSTWQEGFRLCQAAAVGTLVIFHHDPAHDDAFMDRVAAEAKRVGNAIVAREGLFLRP